jgi:hypothetical protein
MSQPNSTSSSAALSSTASQPRSHQDRSVGEKDKRISKPKQLFTFSDKPKNKFHSRSQSASASNDDGDAAGSDVPSVASPSSKAVKSASDKLIDQVRVDDYVW